MTKLLATRESVEALAYAREMISRLHRSDDHGASGSLFEAEENRQFVRNFMRWGLQTAIGRMMLVEAAVAGDSDARALLRNAILELQSRRVEMPTEFIEYNMKLVAEMLPSIASGPKRSNAFMRDVSICLVIAAVRDRFKFKPTGRSARTRSACSIVAEALAVINMALGYKAIETIWKKYGHAMPTVPGWASSL